MTLWNSTPTSCDCSGRDLWRQWPLPSGVREWYTTRKALNIADALQCTALPHIAASVLSTTTRAGCTTITRCGWKRCAADCTQPLTRRSAIAGPEAGYTTAPAKLASGKPLSPEKRGNNADVHLKRHGPPSEALVVAVTNGRLDGSTERSTELTPRVRRGLWHIGADLFRPGGMAGPGISTAGGGNGYWSRLSGSSGNQSCPGSHGGG
jgi:hypothetical protein